MPFPAAIAPWEVPPLPLQPEEEDVYSDVRKPLLQWMEEDYHLSRKVHGLADRWTREYGPFWVPIIEALNDTVTREVWVYAPAQSGKSTVATGWLGYTVDADPAPMSLVMPRKEDCSERVETNIIPMFESNDRLLRHAGGTVRNINIGKLTMFDNMPFYLMASGSAQDLAGKAICKMVLDEVGKFERRVGKEADTVTLARDRLETYKDRSKLLGATTPVEKGDLADREWTKGDRCEWSVRCAHCRKYHVMKWVNVVFDKGPDGHMLEADTYRQGGHARYICPHCKSPWTETDRWQAVCEGQYVPDGYEMDDSGQIIGDPPPRMHRSFRISCLMLHPGIQTIDYLAAKWADAIKAMRVGDKGPMQGFINSRLAEVWEEREKEPDYAKLLPHRSDIYERGVVPPGVQLLTASVDIQLDHLWLNIQGWGYQFESWDIYTGRLETGSTEIAENYEILRQMLNTTWPLYEDPKIKMRLSLAGLDCGYRTDLIYDLCRRWTELPVVPVMGYGEDRIPGRLYRYSKLADGLVRYDINVDRFKDVIYRLLFVQDTPGPGYAHLYKDMPEEHLQHLVNEHQTPMTSGRRTYLVWKLNDAHKPNHLWDCKVYNRFLAEIAGVTALPDPEEKTHQVPVRSRTDGADRGFLSDIPRL